MDLDRKKMVNTFSALGEILAKWERGEAITGFQDLLPNDLSKQIQKSVSDAEIHNRWFTKISVCESFKNWGLVLQKEKLEQWLQSYKTVKQPKKVGLILAGNIPLVGFHDVLAVIFSGNKAIIKLSQDDKILIPLILKITTAIQPELSTRFDFADKLKNIDAIIATGSDNTARYFEQYFGQLPKIIRRNRTAVAVLTGNETSEELENLGKDIFTYFGLGCRNVSHLIIPKNYDLNKFFAAIVKHGNIINHNKYGNNYDYYKTIFLMNNEKIIENGFILLKEKTDLFTPVAVLNYHFYETQKEIDAYLASYREKIQVVIGKNYLPFGEAQCPALDDYADGVDTMKFLQEF